MITLPINGQWTQPNNSDKFGSVWCTKNINFDEEGYMQLSPRSVMLKGESSDSNLGIPVAIGRYSTGSYLLATSDSPYEISLSSTELSVIEDTGTLNPTMTINSHAVWWADLWHASTATAVLSRTTASDTWTSRITGLTSGVRHYMEIFKNRNQLAVSNGNVIKQYDSSYANTTDLTLPVDFEVIGMAYNNTQMGIITRLGDDTAGQNVGSYFFTWDGATTSANQGVAIGSDMAIAVCPYKSSFAILCRNGELLYWNGGGFDVLARFPYFYLDKIIGSLTSVAVFGNSMISDGDIILINATLNFNEFGKKEEKQLPNCPSGIWCFDPKVGLYHRYSGSISTAILGTVSDVNFNVATDTLTITSGTVPATGGIARLTNVNDGLVGLTKNTDYYIIKTASTSFKLATTREKALLGDAIDITASGTGDGTRFWLYDILDYGNTHNEQAGAVAFTGSTNAVYQDVIFGGDYKTTGLVSSDSLCITVPFLENRGYAISPKIFSSEITDNSQKIVAKFRKLRDNDAILIKEKHEEVIGLPVSSPSNGSTDEAVWTSDDEFYTQTDISEAKTYIDAGGELELELTEGTGAGQMVKITSISSSGSTYAVALEEKVVGASAGLKSHFIIDNWKVYKLIDTDSTENGQGYVDVAIGQASKFIQFKVELRGYETTIEELQIINKTHLNTV